MHLVTREFQGDKNSMIQEESTGGARVTRKHNKRSTNCSCP